MTATTTETAAPDVWQQMFAGLEQRTGESSPAWLRSLRHGGNAMFGELGFPTTQDEEWRFTNVAPIAALAAKTPEHDARVSAADLEPFTYHGMPCHLVVFVDGRHRVELSSAGTGGAGVSVRNLAAACADNDPALQQHLARHARCDENTFVALNTSMLEEGAAIEVERGAKISQPILLLFISTGRTAGVVTHPRVFILGREQSEACVIEKYVSLGAQAHFTNAVTEIILEESARLEHCKIQEENMAAFHVATIHAHQKRNSHLLTHSISLGAAIARNNIIPVLDAEGCECTMNGLYLGRGKQLVDHHTTIHHAKPNCNSHEFYHGILDGQSQGVFNGKIFVRPDAQKTDAKQTNRNLLLSDEATVHTKPQLEIFADDVKCTHGATVGQLDDEHIFYLRARGIGLENARRMLVHAFASDIVNRISIGPVRDELDDHFYERFERAPAVKTAS